MTDFLDEAQRIDILGDIIVDLGVGVHALSLRVSSAIVLNISMNDKH